MASSYTANSGIEKVATGEQSGTWGTTTNNNFDIIDRVLNGVGAVTLSGTTHTLTTTDGTLSDGMYSVLVFGGTPSGTNTVTISPNDQQKVYYVKNDSGESVVLTQGTGGNTTVLNGQTKLVYSDGAGAGAEVVDLTASLAAGFESGTSQLFQQTTAPTGWTKDTTNNDDSAVRVVTGTAGTGGTTAFTSAFGTPGATGNLSGDPAVGNMAVSISGNIADTTLTLSQIPSHSHSYTKHQSNTLLRFAEQSGRAFTTGGANTSNAGGGGAHNHSHNLGGNLTGAPGVGNLAIGSATTSINVKYVDQIVATKD